MKQLGTIVIKVAVGREAFVPDHVAIRVDHVKAWAGHTVICVLLATPGMSQLDHLLQVVKPLLDGIFFGLIVGFLLAVVIKKYIEEKPWNETRDK